MASSENESQSKVHLSEQKFLTLVKTLEESLSENKDLLKKKRRRRKAAWKKRQQKVDIDEIIWGSDHQESQTWCENWVQKKLAEAPQVSGRDPVLLISYGPPGSGKSSFAMNIAEKKNLNCVEVNVDLIVKDYIHKILKEPSLFHDQQSYMKIRMGWPEKVRLQIIEHCFKTNRDLLVETTGRNCDVANNVIKPSMDYGYEAIVVYVIVPFVDLVSRVISREKKTKQSHPPLEALLQMCKSAAGNISDFREACRPNGRVLYISNCGSEGEAMELKTAADLIKVLNTHGFIDSVKFSILSSLPLNTH